MLYRSTLDGTPLTLAARSHTLTLGLDERVVGSWDMGGRLFSYYCDDLTYRRSLGGDILQKWREGGARRWRTLRGTDADAVVDEAARLAARVLGEQSRASLTWDPSPSVEARAGIAEVLERAVRFTAAPARADAREFWRIYQPIGILPPDQYLSIVVQATHGCSFNTCTFCDLHHDGYTVKTPEAFVDHCRQALAWLGASAELRRRTVFVGSANALAAPMSRLVALLAGVRDAFGAAPPPMHAFVDGFTGARKDERDYRTLRDLGLARVYVGLESGHDPLLAFVRKPGRADDVVAAVEAIKGAGIAVAVIVMTGLGGDRYDGPHVADTIAALSRMPLGPGDLLYFSQLVEEPGTAYPRLVEQGGIRPLSVAGCVAQRDAIARAMRARFPAPPRMATYDVREFVY
jgi:hypothetical protein